MTLKNFYSLFVYSICLCLPAAAFADSHKIKIDKHGSTYTADYVVVGAGTAGSVVAKVLSDNLKTSVLALEAGENHNTDPSIQLSINAPEVGFEDQAAYFWPGETIGEPGLNGRPIDWTTGRLLGGGSAVNTLFYCRGTNQLYSQWEQIAGPRWSAENMLNIAKTLEDFSGLAGLYNPDVHGSAGLVNIRQAPSQPTTLAFSLTYTLAAAANVPVLSDYNDPSTPIGVSPYIQYLQSGPDGQYRVSAATAFLNDLVMTADGIGAGGRRLLVLMRSTALRILWDGNKAIGIEFSKDGRIIKARGRKGVILCSGINSCTLLQRSGIGPQELLESNQIPMKFCNPNVGVGVKDHPNMVVLFETPDDTSLTPQNDPNAYSQFVAWLPDPDANANKSLRAVEMIAYAFLPGTLALAVAPLNPQSSGNVQIQSADPLQLPLADLGIFNQPADMDLLVRVFQSYVQPLMNLLIGQGFSPIGLTNDIINDPAQLTQFIRSQIELFGGIHNYMGMTRMAPLDQGGVVDEFGRVYGVQNLLLPTTPSALSSWTVPPPLPLLSLDTILLRGSLNLSNFFVRYWKLFPVSCIKMGVNLYPCLPNFSNIYL